MELLAVVFAATTTIAAAVSAAVSWKELEHPKSHLSLGQYENCQIPVSAPLTPACFMGFILRNFYNTAFINYSDRLHRSSWWFDDTIHLAEECVVYIKIPKGPVRRPVFRLPWKR